MEDHWQLQEAKNKFSEVVQKAHSVGAQVITVRGKPSAVVLDYATYLKLARPTQSLIDFFQTSPLADVELDLTRSKDTGRTVDW